MGNLTGCGIFRVYQSICNLLIKVHHSYLPCLLLIQHVCIIYNCMSVCLYILLEPAGIVNSTNEEYWQPFSLK